METHINIYSMILMQRNCTFIVIIMCWLLAYHSPIYHDL